MAQKYKSHTTFTELLPSPREFIQLLLRSVLRPLKIISYILKYIYNYSENENTFKNNSFKKHLKIMLWHIRFLKETAKMKNNV